MQWNVLNNSRRRTHFIACKVLWLFFILTNTCHFSAGSKLPVQDYRLIGDMRFLNLFFLLTRYVTCSFIPPKIKLWRTSCCQILAIYSIVKGDHPPRSRSLALTPTCLLVPSRQGRAGETLGTRMDGHVVIMMSTYVRVSLRSKHFRLVSEQRKSEERDFRFWPSEKWNESQKMKDGGGFLPLLPTLSPLTRAALKHTTRPACNKAASQCCLSLKRFVVVLAGFATFFTSNYVSKCFNGFDRRRKIHLYLDERKTGQEHWEDSLWRGANARNVSFSICLWW